MKTCRKLTLAMSVVLCFPLTTAMAQQAKDTPSIIDVYLHALHADSFGSPTPPVCSGEKDLVSYPLTQRMDIACLARRRALRRCRRLRVMSNYSGKLSLYWKNTTSRR
jgi:hypothetical protein